MKRILCAVLLAAILISAVSCSEKTVTYKDNLSPPELASLASSELTNAANIDEVDDFYIEASMGIDVSKSESHYAAIQTGGTELDEFGIFKMSDETKAEEMKKDLEAYLKDRVDNYDTRYYIEELPKFEKAEVRVFGKYAVFAVLSETDKTAFFTSIEDTLK